jgi:hypothetical protein
MSLTLRIWSSFYHRGHRGTRRKPKSRARCAQGQAPEAEKAEIRRAQLGFGEKLQFCLCMRELVFNLC